MNIALSNDFIRESNDVSVAAFCSVQVNFFGNTVQGKAVCTCSTIEFKGFEDLDRLFVFIDGSDCASELNLSGSI